MFDNKPKTSVLLATFKGVTYLTEQLKSIKSQSSVEVFIVASDDCSSDHALKLLNGACDLDGKLILLPKIKLGSVAANFFRLFRDADLTHVDYVALSDQDDVWQADKLSHAEQKTQENNADAYSSKVTAFWPDGKQKLINKAQSQQQWDFMFESAGPGCTFVLTKKLAIDIQQFLITNREKCHQVALHDWFIYAFAKSKGFKWFIDSESHMLYRQHADYAVGANVGLKAKLARWEKLLNGWLIKQALLIADILGYANAWPVSKLKRYNFLDRLILIVNIKKLCRCLRDRIAFMLFLLLPLRK